MNKLRESSLSDVTISRNVDLREASPREIPASGQPLPESRRTVAEPNVLCEWCPAVPFFLLVRLCCASSARIQFGTVMNDSSKFGQIRVPPFVQKKKGNLRLSRQARGDTGLRRA